MKILKSNPITSFGGLNFVLNEFNNQRLNVLFNKYLPCLPSQSKYYWKDIFYSLWSVFFCGGDCTEDLSTIFFASFIVASSSLSSSTTLLRRPIL